MRVISIFLLLAACSTNDGSPDANASFPAACPQTTCAPASATVHSVGELDALLQARTWTSFAFYTTGCLPASDDIVVQGTLTLDAQSLTRPSGCGADCRTEIAYRLLDAPAGVTCDELDPIDRLHACSKITITNTTLRVRTLIEDIHPASPNSTSVLELMGPCTEACPTSAFTCEESHTCWGSERDYCAYCLGGTNETCACWHASGLAADGTTCSIYVSGDVTVGGVCAGGACSTVH